MLLEQTHPLFLLLSPTKSIEQLEQELQQRISGNQGLEGATIKIAPEMEARLTGQDFEIKAVTPEILAVSGMDETRWQWDVTPTKQGIRTLHLTLSAILSINNHSSLRAVQTFDKSINVAVTVRERVTGFVSRNWQWLWGVIGIPSLAWIWTKKRKRREPAGFRS